MTPYVEAQATGPVEETAIVAAMRILEIDPRQDIAYRALFQAYQERGDTARADHYRRQRDRVREIHPERRSAPIVMLPPEQGQVAPPEVVTDSQFPPDGEAVKAPCETSSGKGCGGGAAAPVTHVNWIGGCPSM